MSADRIRVTVDGEPVSAEVSWEQVRVYLTAKGWAHGKNAHGNEMWTCSESMPCQLFPKSWSIPVALNRIAIHEQRHLAAVLRDIARGIEQAGVEPLSGEELAALRAAADWIGFAIEPHDNAGPVTMAAEDVRRIADMAAMVKRLLGTLKP